MLIDILHFSLLGSFRNKLTLLPFVLIEFLMARSSIQTKCSMCDDDGDISCKGCFKDFCFDHLTQHRQLLNEQFSVIQNEYNQIKRDIIDMKNNSQQHPSIKLIDQWEGDSIRRIKQKADECRQLLNDYTNQSLQQVEIQLNETRLLFTSNEKRKKDCNETHLNNLREKLEELKKQLNQSQNISIEQKSNSFISEIAILLTSKKIDSFIPTLNLDQTWKQSATTVAGGYECGNKSNQLANPWGMFIDHDQTIVIADYANHRIVEWKTNSTNGHIVAGGRGQGDRNDQLCNPTKVIIDQQTDSLIICDFGNRRVMRWPRRNGRFGEVLMSNFSCWDCEMDKDGYLYVSDRKKHEVKRYKIGEETGTTVAGGNGEGDRLDQLNTPTHIFIDEDQSVYVSDLQNHRVMKWVKGATEGIVVAGGQGEGNGLKQLAYPYGMIVDQLNSLYIADLGNDRVMRWLKGAEEGTIVVGGNGRGKQPNQFNTPIDLCFDQEKNLYVLDHGNHRVQRLDVN